jgi:hypothetical protein
MNVITELENDLVFALLVEKKTVENEKINSENAIALIGKIKTVLQSNLGHKKGNESTLLSKRSASPYAY